MHNVIGLLMYHGMCNTCNSNFYVELHVHCVLEAGAGNAAGPYTHVGKLSGQLTVERMMKVVVPVVLAVASEGIEGDPVTTSSTCNN
jgi:hypothetical protein